jgi:hypothetical protein
MPPVCQAASVRSVKCRRSAALTPAAPLVPANCRRISALIAFCREPGWSGIRTHVSGTVIA